MNIGEWVKKWTAIQPHKTAIIFEESSLTYKEVSGRANQLANALRNSEGSCKVCGYLSSEGDKPANDARQRALREACRTDYGCGNRLK